MWLSCRNHGREPIFQVQTSEASRQPSKGGEEGLARPISLSTPCRGFPPPRALQRDTGRQHLHSGPRRPIFSLPTSVTKDNHLCCFRSLRLCNLLQHEGTHTLPPSSADLEDPPLFLFQTSATVFPQTRLPLSGHLQTPPALGSCSPSICGKVALGPRHAPCAGEGLAQLGPPGRTWRSEAVLASEASCPAFSLCTFSWAPRLWCHLAGLGRWCTQMSPLSLEGGCPRTDPAPLSATRWTRRKSLGDVPWVSRVSEGGLATRGCASGSLSPPGQAPRHT